MSSAFLRPELCDPDSDDDEYECYMWYV